MNDKMMTEKKTIDEKQSTPIAGWGLLIAELVLIPFSIWMIVKAVMNVEAGMGFTWFWVYGAVGGVIALLIAIGFYILQPNQAGALVLFGDYKGTVKRNGFLWRNPFCSVKKISLRARNLNGEKLKVNDKTGNPIEIAAVVVWKVDNTAHALFEVDDYEEYVTTQSEAAIRHLAGLFPYDSNEQDDTNTVSLRQSKDEVNDKLTEELQERLSRSGVLVQEARISHLAYAPEIAGAMLRRQQAEAVISARKKIVEGAVSMVEMALQELNDKHVVELDEERKATMISNLLVVLCSEESTQPVINAGSLYS